MRGKPYMDGWLTAEWKRPSRRESPDVVFSYPASWDGHMLHDFFSHVKSWRNMTFIEELKDRGYDITTLKFSVKRKWASGEPKPEGV